MVLQNQLLFQIIRTLNLIGINREKIARESIASSVCCSINDVDEVDEGGSIKEVDEAGDEES